MSEGAKNRRQLSRSRSISARSNWDISTANGEEDSLTRSNSIGYLNEEEIEQRKAWDQHVAKFVSERMERLKAGAMEMVLGDELEA